MAHLSILHMIIPRWKFIDLLRNKYNMHWAIILVAVLASHSSPGQIYHLGELSTTQFSALDPETTVIIIPTGVL